MYSCSKCLSHPSRWMDGLSVSILSSLCHHSLGIFKFFSLSFMRYFGLIISCISSSCTWLCNDEFCSKDYYLYSDIYPILVIICNTSVGNWGHIIFASLSISFLWYVPLTIIKAQENIKKPLKICSIRKFISPFLNVQNTNNLSNLFPGQTQAEYYRLGPRIILIMALYSISLQTINPLFPPLESWPHKSTFTAVPLVWWARWITFPLYPLQENFLNYTRVCQ